MAWIERTPGARISIDPKMAELMIGILIEFRSARASQEIPDDYAAADHKLALRAGLNTVGCLLYAPTSKGFVDPWPKEIPDDRKAYNRGRQLKRAAAMILAEIERVEAEAKHG
jgi:hypothetical protein